MSQHFDEFGTLMQRVREGSQDAARELSERYGPHILRIVRKKLASRLRSMFDSDDFAQAVWVSFFADLTKGKHFDRPEALAAFLARLAQNKVLEVLRRCFYTQKHNVNRERSLDNSVSPQGTDLPARQPTPSQLAAAREQWDRLLATQPEHGQRILVLLAEGHTHQEIAQMLQLNEKTVRRLVSRLIKGLGA
jgi:RNA polymerase sigma factor (sigma-70 family)